MPIANRCIEPVYLSQIKVPSTVSSEFEYIVNATLSNLIKQIACLSLKANDIFGELVSSLSKFVNRAESLEIKIQTVYQNIEFLDTSVMNPLVNQKVSVFRSINDRDDELLDHTQMPECIKEMFDSAIAPPELFKFDEFHRKDGESMRIYTDPDFFLREWLNNARNDRKKKKEKNKNRKSRHVNREITDIPLPPPIIIDNVIQESILDNNSLDYNFGDVAVYEDPTVFKMSENIHKVTENRNNETEVKRVVETPCHPIPPPPPSLPPILVNFPPCLPPAPPQPPQAIKNPLPSTNLLAEIHQGKVLKPVSAREDAKESKAKAGDFRELIKELRPAWENQSDDDSDESDD